MTNTLLVSHRSADLLLAAQEWISGWSRADQVVVLGPTAGSAHDFARSFAGKRGGALGIHRLTLSQMAAEIGLPRLMAEGKALLTPLATQALISRVIHKSLRGGLLQYFQPVDESPGFSRALSSTLQD